MSDCPGADLILLSLHDLIDDPAEAERFDQHLTSCESCTAQRIALESALETPPVLEPPPEVLASLHEQIAEEAAKAPRALPADVRVRLLCTYCKDDLPRPGEGTPEPGALTVYCATCLAPSHSECFDDHGSCAAPGCSGKSRVHVRPLQTPEPARPLRSAAIILLSAVLGGGIVAALGSPRGDGASGLSVATPAPSVTAPAPDATPPPLAQRRGWSERRVTTYVGGAVVVELDYGGDPTAPVQPRSLPSREVPEPTLLHLDGISRVDWIQPSPDERAYFLVQGLGEGATECKVEFADGSEALTIRIEVSGEDPHVHARQERQELDRETRSPRLLARLRGEALEAGERLQEESKLPARESSYRQAFLQFARASDAAEALGAAEGRRGGRTPETSDWIKRTRFAELQANLEWEKACHLALSQLETLWPAPPSEELRQQQGQQLAQALRLVHHSCDPRFRRLEVILRQSFPELVSEVQLELCPQDERAKPAPREPLSPGLALIQQGIVISLVKERGQVVVRIGSTVLSRPEDWTGGEPKDAPVWARLEAELQLLRERAGARASLLLEVSPDLPTSYATLAVETVSRAGITDVSLVVSAGTELSERERRDLTAYRTAVDIIRGGQVSRFDLARQQLKTIDPSNRLASHAQAYLDWLDADAEVRQAQAFYAAGATRQAFDLLSDAYNHPSLDRYAKESVRKLQTRWGRVARSYERAQEHERAGRLLDALREFREVIAQEPDRDNALNLRARERVETLLLQPAPLAPGPTLAAAPFTATLTNTLKGGLLTLEGRAQGYPEGTKLHVRLVIAPRAPQLEEAEVAFFMTPVSLETFKASKTFAKRRLIPGSYTLSVELKLAAQRQSVSQAIRREFGLPRDARVLLGKHVIQVGTPTEVAAYDKAWNLELRERLARHQGNQQRLTTLEAEIRRSGQAPTPETFKGLAQRLREARLRQDDVVSAPGQGGPLSTLTKIAGAQSATLLALGNLKFERAQALGAETATLLQEAQAALR